MNYDFIADLHHDEEVKPAEGFPRGYFITNYGRLYAQGPGLGKKGRWLKPTRQLHHATAYRWHYFTRKRMRAVHRLVAQHFLPDFQEHLCVCHRNEALTDHRAFHLSNLFMGTWEDNMQDMVKKGRWRNQWSV